jgi:hypothetical protein
VRAASDPIGTSGATLTKVNDGKEATVAKVRIVSLTLTAVVVSVCTFTPLAHAQSNAASNHAQQVQVISAAAHGMAENPGNIVSTPIAPRQFARNSVYATEPPSPSNPVLAGGLTVDEAGGAPLYAIQLTHPSGPVMDGGDDVQLYGRDSVYFAGSMKPPSTKTALW